MFYFAVSQRSQYAFASVPTESSANKKLTIKAEDFQIARRSASNLTRRFSGEGKRLLAPVTILCRGSVQRKGLCRGLTRSLPRPVHVLLRPGRTRAEKRNAAFPKNGMNTTDAALQTLRGDVINIVLGSFFLAVGATACAIAAI